ncbi:MAG: hypothetical protein JWP11_2215 [Frankiales bacterium]|nr:hypothetical protein [Frankiales bacterium]
MTTPKRTEVQAAAAVLREVLAKVDAGELEAPGRRGSAVVARIESAALGLDVAAGAAGRDP